jgi:hypothetical protein
MTAAFKNERIGTVIRVFGLQALRRSSIFMEFEAFLKRINAKGKCCLEIGTYNGLSTMILAQYFEKVVAVTVEDAITDRDLKRRIWAEVGANNIEAFEINNDADKAVLLEKIPFDFAYLDGNHEESTAADYALTQRCGRLLFHEYWPLQPSVFNLVNTLPKDEVTLAHYDCLAYWERKRG